MAYNERYLWHYTTPEGLAAIKRSQVIRASDSQLDARYGPGVYLTSRPPHTATNTLLWNNYDGAARGQDRGRTYCYVRLLQNQVLAEQCPSDRDIYIVRGPIHLAGLDVMYGQRAGSPKQHAISSLYAS